MNLFTRARLRLTALYTALMAVVLALVAGAILIVGVRETRLADDLALRLQAEGIAARVGRGEIGRDRPLGPDDDGDREDGHRLEQQGTLTYVLPVDGGYLIS